jgi:hypothetical protein
MSRDNELDELLAPLRKQTPSDIQMSRWKSAVKRARSSENVGNRNSSFLRYAQLIAAMIIGIVIGAFAVGSGFMSATKASDKIPTYSQNNSSADATFERQYTKLD